MADGHVNEQTHDRSTPTENINESVSEYSDSSRKHVPHGSHSDVHNHTHNALHMAGSESQRHSNRGDNEDVTAHRILNLLSEIGHSSFVDNMTFLEKQFHPCKYCKGRLQIL